MKAQEIFNLQVIPSCKAMIDHSCMVVSLTYTESLVCAFFWGPSKMRMSQKTHQLNQNKIKGNMGPSDIAIK